MKTPRKHAEFIKAWADGAEIESRWCESQPWNECLYPSWSTEAMYRVKPEPKPDVVRHAIAELSFNNVYIYIPSSDKPNLKLTFDSETGKLKLAEVI